jgi:hypothetical protein
MGASATLFFFFQLIKLIDLIAALTIHTHPSPSFPNAPSSRKRIRRRNEQRGGVCTSIGEGKKCDRWQELFDRLPAVVHTWTTYLSDHHTTAPWRIDTVQESRSPYRTRRSISPVPGISKNLGPRGLEKEQKSMEVKRTG